MSNKEKSKREEAGDVGVPSHLAKQFLKDLQAAHDRMKEKEKEEKKGKGEK